MSERERAMLMYEYECVHVSVQRLKACKSSGCTDTLVPPLVAVTHAGMSHEQPCPLPLPRTRS